MIFYYFKDHFRADLPAIVLRRKAEIPPLKKAFSISLRAHANMSACGIGATWRTDERFKIILARCPLNNERIKKQLCQLDETLIEIISSLFSSSMNSCKIETASMGKIIQKDELPEDLQPVIDQFQLWKNFLESFAPFINHRHPIFVDIEGYYNLVFNIAHYKPEDDPTGVIRSYAYWIIESSKIKLLLPHESCNKRIAASYDYLDIYERFIRDKEIEEEQRKERLKEYLKRKNEKEARLKEDLLEFFSPEKKDC